MDKPTIVTKQQEKKGLQLLIGIIGIYCCYWSSGYLQEKILKSPYHDASSSPQEATEQQYFDSAISMIWIQSAVAWFLGYLINNYFYRLSSQYKASTQTFAPTKIPVRKILVCSILVTVSALSSNLAIKITSFPIVMMIKSCSIIPVVFVGICCSRVKDHTLKLGVQKIIIAFFITVGIMVYNFGGSQSSSSESTSFLGIALMVISIMCDGFLPDFQAVIKSEVNPKSTEMFQHTNKWVTLISLLYAGATGSISYLVNFGVSHPQCISDLILFSILAAVGQIFVYRLVKQFKQHIVPFVITTRKIFTVVISIVVYKHETTALQITGIAIVFFSACYEYCSEIFWNRQSIKSKQEITVTEMIRDDIKSENTTEQSVHTSKEKLQVIS